LTGGEPLLHPEIENILERVRCLDLGLAIETNGVLCTSVLAQKIAGCKNAHVSVSLDGVDAATHEWLRGVGGCFEATLAGIRNLVGAGIKPELVMALHRRNRDQMEAFLRLAESLGAQAVKFNIVQPIARGQKMHDEAETLSIPELVGLGRWVETRLSKTTRLPVLFDHPMAFRPLSRLFGENGTACQRCHILGILGLLTNGGYALCGIGYAVPELVFGHSERDRLEEVWDRAAVLVELRKGLPKRLEGVCATCLMKRICLGCCIANNYHQGRRLWSPFWYCQQALQTGLFPKSRICATENS
jgi:SynChlorMet cassette radical SAM/SPASM protein ScmF